MARLNGLIIGGERKVFLDAALALGFGIAEPLEKLFSVSDLKIPFGKLALVFEEYIAIGHALIVEGEIIDVVDPLNIHGEPLKSVGQFARSRLAIEAAHLLDIGELRHFHAVAPDFPAKTPCAKRRRFPVIYDKANVVAQRINPILRKAAEIQLLPVGRGWMLDPQLGRTT